ncbi:MAG: PRD domain-containing protein [Tetragenococcus koreensis]|uniref:PRD domain-containing protein n=1 Tax=Tetragenococcus halophilus TaxID=51669 RepID=A0AB35HLZ1_TETHA|nr:PRD domain-containing protein [Tetragenococcus halophilus]MDN6571894.1 PRD domain-containing protein [Staphylococcus equorum]MDN6730702.1 PRD domain-containing protein [Atopostipes suicloacalis]MDN6733154.1 PRD domain-containing protein [Tetragenococcus koreensis]MCF1684652.1 PRD domain-containing protein [Tetragenococcus halophilus]MCO8297089.1 PRD domain-containing protein [Tetragenococcus halophilus]
MNTQYTDSKTRRLHIFERLLNYEHLSYQQLSEEYFVSRSSIANDISYIKRLFSKEDLSLTFDNSGTFFAGNEIQVQKLLKRIILQHEEVMNIDDCLIKQIADVFHKAIEKREIDIPESHIENIVVSIYLIISRSKKGYQIQLDGKNQFGRLFLEFDKYPIVYDLLKEIESQGIYHFSSEEAQHLTYLIVGSGMRFFLKDEKIPFSFRERIRILIQKVSEGISTDLSQDKHLEEDVVVHLYQLFLRSEAQTTIVNPLINEIKQMYPSLFGVVWFALSDFCKTYQISLSDDEVGFVAIHFQAAVERLKKMNKILFVCPNGIGTSSYVSAKIRRILPDINSIETVSTSKLKNMEISDVDFIISTVPINEQRKPIVTISPMVTAKDMKKILNYYIDLIICNEQKMTKKFELSYETRSLVGKDVIFGNFSTKKNALGYLFKRQNFSDELLKENFIDSVWEREELQSTYLGNGFAIPHGNPDFVEETSVSILVLDKAISWGNQLVDIIALLLIREEDDKKIEPVMNLIMQGIEDKNWFISKMMEVKE